MTYRVRWRRRALNRLTTLWLQSDSAMRKALTAASNAIDQELGKIHSVRVNRAPGGDGSHFFRHSPSTFVLKPMGRPSQCFKYTAS
jgi:hypothetical protein